MQKIFYLLLFSLLSFSVQSQDLFTKKEVNFYAQFVNANEVKDGDILDFENETLKKLINSDKVKIYPAKTNPFLQKFIDDFFLNRFFNSKVDQTFDSLCSVFAGTDLLLTRGLGVSDSVAFDIYKRCIMKYYLGNGNINYHVNLIKLFREYFFVVGGTKELDSWTTQIGSTFIFIDEMEPFERIYSRIVHEVFISVDQLNYFSHRPDEFINRKKVKVVNKRPFSFGAKKSLRRIMQYMRDPKIGLPFTVMRAETYERQVLKDELYLFKDDKNCRDLWLRKAKSLEKYSQVLELNNFQREDFEKVSIEEFYKIMEETEILVLYKGLELYTCELLALPLQGTINTFFGNGPKPRVGGGWSNHKELSLENIIEKKLTSEDIDIILKELETYYEH